MLMMNESTNENDVLLVTKEQYATALDKLGYTEKDYFFLLEPAQLMRVNLPLNLMMERVDYLQRIVSNIR